MFEHLKTLIADIAAGAADGVSALQSVGVPVSFDGYSVEAHIGADPTNTTTVVRVDFVVGDAHPR